jgi:hypothetical protein
MKSALPVLAAAVTLALAAAASRTSSAGSPAPIGAEASRAAAQEQAEQEVRAAAAAIIAAFGRDDPESYFPLFDPAATFIFHSTPYRLESRAAYEREWATWRRDFGFGVLSCSSSAGRVQLLGDVAVFTHSVRTVIVTNEGESTLYERETIVFQRRDAKWIAVHEHLSPDPGAFAANAGS